MTRVSSAKLMFYFALAAIGPLLLCSAAWAGEEQQAAKPGELRVLYAGNPTSDRAADFEKLLAKHFAKVKVADYSKFKPADADEFDVVIFDWTSIYPRDAEGNIDWKNQTAMAMPPAPPLTRDFDRPAILIGGAGGSICNRMAIAINWK